MTSRYLGRRTKRPSRLAHRELQLGRKLIRRDGRSVQVFGDTRRRRIPTMKSRDDLPRTFFFARLKRRLRRRKKEIPARSQDPSRHEGYGGPPDALDTGKPGRRKKIAIAEDAQARRPGLPTRRPTANSENPEKRGRCVSAARNLFDGHGVSNAPQKNKKQKKTKQTKPGEGAKRAETATALNRSTGVN